MTHDVKPATRFRARPQKVQAEMDPLHEEAKDRDGYEVGYRKPPKHSQFRRGLSGNPKGRPKGTKRSKSFLESLLESVAEDLDQMVTLRENGKEITVSRQRGLAKRLVTDAISGKAPMMKLVLGLMQASQKSVGDVPDLRELSNADAELLTMYFRDMSDE